MPEKIWSELAEEVRTKSESNERRRFHRTNSGRNLARDFT
jgi:hypothetical protein